MIDRSVAIARLVDRRRLRAMLLALRRDPRSFDSPRDPDPDLIDPVARPFTSISDAHDRLTRLENRLRNRRDRRSIFLTIYGRMTRAVERAVDGGTFRDPDWMAAYTVAFANYYRRAFLAFERGSLGAVPDPWRVAFGAAVGETGLVAQDAFLGINAHINYDLALALRDVGIDPNRPTKKADHLAINPILARLVDAQQQALAELYAPGLETVDMTAGRLDESLSLLSLTEGRAQAWRIAVVLTDVQWSPIGSYARWVLRATATGGAFLILGPTLDPTVRRALERVEAERFAFDEVMTAMRDRLDHVDLP